MKLQRSPGVIRFDDNEPVRPLYPCAGRAAGADDNRPPRLARLAGEVLATVSAVLVVSCSPPAPAPARQDPVVLTVGAPETRGLGPTRWLQSFAAGLVTNRLTSSDAQGRPVPRLVVGWHTSTDGLSWQLSVRAGVRFIDGTPLTSIDIRDAIRRVAASPEYRDTYVCLSDITDVATSGDHDVIVRLARPCYFLLDELDVDVLRPTPAGRRVGTAAFSVVSSSNDVVELEANPFYYLGRPAIDRIVLRAYDTLRTAWAAMMRGQCDFLWEVGPDSLEFLRDQSIVMTRSFESYKALAIVFNGSRLALRDVAVRRALNLAIDRTELVQAGLRGQGQPADVPVWPNFWALDQAAPRTPFDPVRARAMLAQVAPLSFTCLLPDNYAVSERVALLAQRQLRAVGVEMRLEVLPPAAFIARVGRGDFDTALIDPLGGPYPAFFYRFWHSPDPNPRWNSFGYHDVAADAALDAMKAAVTDDQFRAATSRFVAALRDNPPAIYLVWPITTQAVSRRFVLPPDTAGKDALPTAATWRLREGRQ